MKLFPPLRLSGRRSAAFVAVATVMLGVVNAACAAAGGAQDEARGRKYKEPPPVAHISVVVSRASNGKPVENAAVIFHTFHQGKDQGNMEVKTNEDGKAIIDVIPIGDEVQVQVFKTGFQTYGQTFTNDLASRDLMIKVKPPSGQYSTYQKEPLSQGNSDAAAPQPTQSTAKPKSQPH